MDPDLDVGLLYMDQLRYVSLEQDERNNEVLSHMGYSWDKREQKMCLRMNQCETCPWCYSFIVGLSQSTYARREAEAISGKTFWEHGSKGHEGRYTHKGAISRVWMKHYFYSLGDHQPDTGELHLPPGNEKKDIHAEMDVEIEGDIVSYEQFCKIWTEEYPEVTIPKRQRIGKCTECLDYHDRIMETKDRETRRSVVEISLSLSLCLYLCI